MIEFQASPVAQRSNNRKALKNVWKLACTSRSVYSLTKLNNCIPMIENRNKKRRSKHPRLPMAGIASKIVSNIICNFSAFFTIRKILNMRSTLSKVACF